MAVKWAVANGNWSAGATWNDGVIPAVGDYVYLDNHTITIDVDVALGNGTISNGQNPTTTLSGGSLTMSAAHTIVANLDAFAVMINSSGSGVRNFVGNITLHGVTIFFNQSTNNTIGLSITGNVTTEGGTFFQRSSAGASLFNTSINGNVSLENTTLFSTRYTGEKNLTINGNLSLINGGITAQDVYLTTFTLNGSLSNIYGRNILAVDAEVSGNITYASTTGGMGIFANSLAINNPDTFTWKDITEPRSNPFIILTDAEMNNRLQYPAENEVKEGTEYVWGEKIGTYQQPPEAVVLKGYVYDNGDKIGTLENENIVGCVTPEDVRKDVPLVGMGVVGSLVVPSVDDVREGVIFDNGSVGTLIVQGGGDRLRIADFSYYTNAQSDTYIVDLTEQDKPKFAVAEERVLIEMFPDLDLDNIPEKYFDDLFVKYLKYRLIVEYYRTAGINSTFTPSEPTTEIVNYQNVRNEVWLNSANIYLKAWGKKYPESIVKPQRILL